MTSGTSGTSETSGTSDAEMMQAVLQDDFCVGCGNCVIKHPDLFQINEAGKAQLTRVIYPIDAPVLTSTAKLCPFSGSSLNEDDLSSAEYSELPNHDKALGYYSNIYIGWDNDSALRVSSSSGGLATFLISELFDSDMIDAAVVVAYDGGSPNGVRYKVVRSKEAIGSSRQSKYILKGYQAAIAELLPSDERILFVGIPCHVKSIKLLANADSSLKSRLKFTVAVFCGHQKSAQFSEYIAWQLGVQPRDFESLTYRVKKPNTKAHQYFYRAHSQAGMQVEREVTTIPMLDWGLGLFKLKACDFCDDVAGETADIIFGDAWIKPYTDDYRGTNVVICRNTTIEKVLLTAKARGAISLLTKDKSAIFESQGANFRHRKEGLLSRISYFNSTQQWFPLRRNSLYRDFKERPSRSALYVSRYKISIACEQFFTNAKQQGRLEVFALQLKPLLDDYRKLQFKSLSVKQKAKTVIKTFMKSVLRV